MTSIAGSYDEWLTLEKPAIDQVRTWLSEAAKITPDHAGEQLASLLKDPAGLGFTVAFVDGVIRPKDYQVAGKNLVRISQNLPSFLPQSQKLAITIGAKVVTIFPAITIPLARKVLRFLVRHLILDARPRKLTRRIRALRSDGRTKLNIHLLGEMVLGQKESYKRLSRSMELLDRDDVDYVSLKVSSLLSPQAPWGFDEAVRVAKDNLRPLFVKAISYSPHKFINIDMEEYHDLQLTIQVFTQLLDEPQFKHLYAGIVMQTYLPDALSAMITLQQWAANRVRLGGSCIKVRLVKGANLPMEKVESAIHNWPLATFDTKQDTDTNYIRVIEYAMRPENINHIKLGVAGHNLFDIAFCWLLAKRRGITDHVDFEMLLGMAHNQVEALKKDIGSVLFYTPVVHPDEFDVAIAYLIRRLEESASEENFISAIFELDKNPELFTREEERFVRSLRAFIGDAIPQPHRNQDRSQPYIAPAYTSEFVNTVDSDPATAGNIDWSRDIATYMSSTRLGNSQVHKATITSENELDVTIDKAQQASSVWGNYSASKRAQILDQVAILLEERRSAFLEVMAGETGKTLDQSDPEVSEAIDFARFYGRNALELTQIPGATHHPDRIVLIAPPWNFPVAIPAGSTCAALAAGSAVILKPSPQAPRCSALLAQVMWDAGVPKDALQLVIIDEETLGEKLVTDPRIDRIILTGSYDTAALFRSWRPDIPILAETSGKNSMIITPYADYDLAVRDLVSSAFGHAGQKCSAVSLAILVGSVYDSDRLINQLVDAVSSLTVDYPWNLAARMGPIIAPPTGKLLRGLTELDPGEQWLIAPQTLDESKKLWRPGVKIGVQPGSFFHTQELFGPVLGIMHAHDLSEAIELANASDYGLTSGLHSLDPQEILQWINGIKAGNLYVNRSTTGAIVNRQPFGGWKKSAYGPGFKAGGPNYLLGLGRWKRHELPASPTSTTATIGSISNAVTDIGLTDFQYKIIDTAETESQKKWLETAFYSDNQNWDERYRRVVDTADLSVEQNIFRYLPEPVEIRVTSHGSITDFLRVLGAGLRVNSILTLSFASEVSEKISTLLQSLSLSWSVLPDDEWLSKCAITVGPSTRIRLICQEDMDQKLIHELARTHAKIYDQDVTPSGRLELLPFLNEQSISITAHRFGNIIPPISLPDL